MVLFSRYFLDYSSDLLLALNPSLFHMVAFIPLPLHPLTPSLKTDITDPNGKEYLKSSDNVANPRNAKGLGIRKRLGPGREQ